MAGNNLASGARCIVPLQVIFVLVPVERVGLDVLVGVSVFFAGANYAFVIVALPDKAWRMT